MPESQPVQDLNPTNITPNQGNGHRIHSSDIEESEVVKTAEQLSQIISPYFIVLVGLYLYPHNAFFGLSLMTLGFLSLFKVSYENIRTLGTKIKDFISIKLNLKK